MALLVGGLLIARPAVSVEPMGQREILALCSVPDAMVGDAVAIDEFLRGIRPDRALTPKEEVQRDILLRLVWDAEGVDIPIPTRDPEERHTRTIERVQIRRTLAAARLRTLIAHDSMIPRLAEYLETTPSFLLKDRDPTMARNEEEANARMLEWSTRRTRYEVLHALAGSASNEAIAPMIRLLNDPQLGKQSYLYLRRLLRSHIRPGLSESEADQYRANVLFGYRRRAPASDRARAIERTLEWWDQNRDTIQLSRHFAVAFH